MPGKEHCLITEHAINLLEGWEREILNSETNNLIEEYCRYPDTYFDVNGSGYKKAAPYYFDTDGIQFHYIPDTPVVDKYRYWNVADGKLVPSEKAENLNWKHAKNGFTYYLSQTVESLKVDQLKDALSFTGCLLHMLQDSTFSLHSLEGPYGTDLFVLDRLFDTGGNPARLPSNIMCGDIPAESVTTPEYAPVLLGRSIPEAVFSLYTRYVETVLNSRKLVVQIVLDRQSGGKNGIELYEQMFHHSVKLCADVIHTICAIATERFENSESLDNVILSDMEPIERPWGMPGPYRFMTMLRNSAIVANGNIGPLKLIVAGVEREFKKGMSFGCHVATSFVYEIPQDVYNEFDCLIGLQAEYAKTGKARVAFLNDGEIVFEKEIDSATPSHNVTIHNPGGIFEIRCSSPNCARTRTVITLGNPELKK